jgi:hypothetical protein
MFVDDLPNPCSLNTLRPTSKKLRSLSQKLILAISLQPTNKQANKQKETNKKKQTKRNKQNETNKMKQTK